MALSISASQNSYGTSTRLWHYSEHSNGNCCNSHNLHNSIGATCLDWARVNDSSPSVKVNLQQPMGVINQPSPNFGGVAIATADNASPSYALQHLVYARQRQSSEKIVRERCDNNADDGDDAAAIDSAATIRSKQHKQLNAVHQQRRLSMEGSKSLLRNHQQTQNAYKLDNAAAAAQTEMSALRSARSETNLRPHQRVAMLADADLRSVAMMYQNIRSEVTVCKCLANLYLFDLQRSSADWQLLHTGIPVLIRNCDSQRLSIVIADKVHGFQLRQDLLDAHEYEEKEQRFHTFPTSSGAAAAKQLAGLSFDSESAAMDFLEHIKRCARTGDPNASNSASTAGKKGRYRERRYSFSGIKKKHLIVDKNQISKPISFQHITSIKPEDLAEKDRKKGNRSRAGRNYNSSSEQLADSSFFEHDRSTARTHSCLQISSQGF